MSDTSLNKIIQYGPTADRTSFTPDPASGSLVLYLWFDTDDQQLYVWDSSSWVSVNAPGGAAIYELTGDVTAGPGTGTQAATLAASGVTPGTYGDASNVPQITIDSKGRITAAVDVPISGSGAAPDDATYLTEIDESANLPNSRQVLAGDAVEFDDTTPNQRIVNVKVDGVTVTVNGLNELEVSSGAGGINQLTGDVTAGPGTGSQAATLASKYKTRQATIVIDGGGSVISTGIKGDLVIPVACTITQVTLLADQTGAIVIDIWKDSYANYPPTDADSITASAPPTIGSGNIKSQDSTLSGWTTSISAGDTLRFNVDSITSITRVTLVLEMTIA